LVLLHRCRICRRLKAGCFIDGRMREK
jgi:hypothetical protein